MFSLQSPMDKVGSWLEFRNLDFGGISTDKGGLLFLNYLYKQCGLCSTPAFLGVWNLGTCRQRVTTWPASTKTLNAESLWAFLDRNIAHMLLHFHCWGKSVLMGGRKHKKFCRWIPLDSTCLFPLWSGCVSLLLTVINLSYILSPWVLLLNLQTWWWFGVPSTHMAYHLYPLLLLLVHYFLWIKIFILR